MLGHMIFRIASPVLVVLVLACTSFAQKKVGEFTAEGVVRSVRPGTITVVDKDGERRRYLIQDKDEEMLSINGDPFRAPCEIKVAGVLPGRLLESGMVVEFKCDLNRASRSQGEVSEFKVVDIDASKWTITSDVDPKGKDYAPCDIIGRIVYVKKGRLLLAAPKTKFSRNARINFQVSDNATFSIETDDLNRVRRGDIVKKMSGIKLDSGDWVVREIEVELSPNREAATISFHDELELKYSAASDEPGVPREFQSSHFKLYTDVSDRQAKVMLGKLERMYEMVTTYYGRYPKGKIECYLVSDLSAFQNSRFRITEAKFQQKILEPAGVTATYRMTQGTKRSFKAVVYSCDNQAICQHEAVHALCGQTFGSAGPTWYAEGVAEMGQYWEPGNLEIRADQITIDYLTSAEPKPLDEVIELGQVTGDSWESYCWRWALCHLLASNPNYSGNFKKLGKAMMESEARGNAEDAVTFEHAYGKFKKEIKFEYDMFVKNFGNGYRVDLCSWDWAKESNELKKGDFSKTVVKALGGWQATDMVLVKGQTYDFLAETGTWKIDSDGKELDANGFDDGTGRLIGVVYKDFKIGKPFDLGTKGSFTAPEDGQLFLRCKDDWLELSDNSGEIAAYFQVHPKNPKP